MADRRERIINDEEVARMRMEYLQSRLWTALPAIVTAYPGTIGKQLTVNVQPAINGLLSDLYGQNTWVQMPILQDCPLLFQGGGGVTATFPVQPGDECLVILASRCIDLWFINGGVQNQAELRMHNLSDGFALVGVRSVPRSFNLDTANACLITDDGNTYFKLNPTSKAIAVQASGGINLNGVTIDSSGNVNSPATITATTDVVGGGKHLKTHTHSGVTSGSGTSGPPS